MMNFYMTPGSCSTGIHILLEELELVFGANIVNLPAGDHLKPGFVAINPKSTIPVLVPDDGRPLTSFVSIAWWLALRHPGAGLLPEGVDAQAEALELIDYTVNTMHGQGFTRIFTTDRYCLRPEDEAAVKDQGREIVDKGFALLARRLEQGDGYLFGRFGIADAALFYVEFWADRIDIPLPPACRRHYALMRSRPVVQRVLREEGYRR